MQFGDLATYLEKLESISSRNEITEILADLFKKTDSGEIDKTVYLILGSLAPNYEGIVFNMADRMVVQAIAKAYSFDPAEVQSTYKKLGDLGTAAESLNKNKKQNEISIVEVYAELLNLANDSGGESVDRKITKLADLLTRVDSLSSRFIARIPIGKLRLGFSDKTIIDALSTMEVGDKSVANEIESAYNIRPDIGYIAKIIKEKGTKDLTHIVKPEVGVPVVPMLAQRLNSASEMVKKMGEVSVEPKYDGLRIFIHYRKKDNFIRIFTRNMNAIDIGTFPELASVGKYIKADEIIIDTEAVGIDAKREMFLDFQKTMSRRRKHDVEKSSSEIPLQFQVFDVLLLNGKSYITTPYIRRREMLEKVIVNGNLLKIDESTITTDPSVITQLHSKYLKMGLEGIIVKKSNGLYVSGRTGWNWVKMKEVEGTSGKLSDTLDLVIMGYTVGKGKRVGFGVGQFLAGVKDGDIFKSVTKVGTGLTDEQFRELKARLGKIQVLEKPKEYEVHKDLFPDFWVNPEVVVEIAADEITKSPKHTAGWALRFPRLIQFRDDKSAKETTTIQELQEMLANTNI